MINIHPVLRGIISSFDAGSARGHCTKHMEMGRQQSLVEAAFANENDVSRFACKTRKRLYNNGGEFFICKCFEWNDEVDFFDNYSESFGVCGVEFSLFCVVCVFGVFGWPQSAAWRNAKWNHDATVSLSAQIQTGYGLFKGLEFSV